MKIFKKTAGDRYISASKKVNKLNEKKKNNPMMSDKEKNKIDRKIADSRAIMKVAYKEIENDQKPKVSITNTRTTFNNTQNRNSKEFHAHLHGHLHSYKKSHKK